MTKATSAYLNKPLRELKDVGDKPMTHTHTPEPWLNELHANDRNEDDFAWVCEVRTQIGALIANVYANDKNICEDQTRLIAAAPDLLKALLMAADYIENDCEATHKNGTILGKARAAIEKATKDRN